MRSIKACIRIFKITAVAAVALIVFSFAACGSVPVSDIQDVPVVEYTLPPVPQDPVPAQGGELTFPIQKPATLNPLKIANVELNNLFMLIYEQPIRIGVDGTAQPELAETWKVDDTGKIWTFNLRKGVKWQGENGEFTSADVIYTIDRIKGYTSSDSRYAKYNSLIEDYNAPDEYTVTLTLKEPGNAAIYFMTFPVLCKSYCSGQDLTELTPVGTGAYKVTSYDENTGMELIANSSWWKEQPYIQKLTAKCYLDHDTQLESFNQNLLDFMTTSILTVDTYEKYGLKKASDYLTNYYDCLILNTKSGFFSDVNMRRAVAYAIDKRDIVSKALLGHAVATDYPVLPNSFLSGGTTSDIYEYNLQKAAALFEKAGWKNRDGDEYLEKIDGAQINDLEISLLIPLNNDNPYRKDVADNLASQLENSGIKVNIIEASNKNESDEYMQSLKNGNFEMALCSFYLDKNPDVSFMLETGGECNYGGYSDLTLDQYLQDCNMALSNEEMKQAYYKMEDAFLAGVPQISLYYKTSALLYDAQINIKGDMSENNIYTIIPQWYLYIKGQEQQ